MATTPYIVGLKEISVKPLAWSSSKNNFFSAVARDASPGSYPRYFSGKQSYWTVIGVNGDSREALIDEQGTLESGKAQFSIEPFLFTNGQLITWNDASRSAGLVGDDLPIPYVTWKTPRLQMIVTAFAAGAPDSSVLYARYRVRNPTALPVRATLYLAVRPFAVNPPWQSLNTQGGVATIDSISYDGRVVRVNTDRTVTPLTPAARFGAMSFDDGNIVDMLRPSRLPSATRAQDQFGRASGALAWDIWLRPNSDSTIDIAIPLHAAGPLCLSGSSPEACRGDWTSRQLQAITSDWREKLGRVDIGLPSSASRFTRTIRSNLAYILINRDGPAIQPGSRSYERSWIRDGALTSAALLRLGHYEEVRDFIDWYARFQFENGKIPCCVDARGADPVPENDSHGEFIYVVAEYYRHTGDRQLLERTWLNISRAFVRLGDKSKAHEVADFFFRHQRPKAWHHWAEVVWGDSLTPRFIGDMPHTWVGSDFIRSTLDMFAYERESDSSLVIGAGIPENWVREKSGVRLRGLSTHYGPLSYDMRAVGETLEVRIETGVRIPAGGFVVRSPSDRRLRQVRINGVAVTPGAGEVVVRSLPTSIAFQY